MNNTAVCVICRTPNDIWMNFLSTFIHYDVYLIVDDNSIDYVEKYKDFKTIHIIQIANEDCMKCGFVNMNIVIRKKIAGWEKAAYYFSILNTTYNHVWILEEDVFVYSESSFQTIDSKFRDSDLLSANYKEKTTSTGDNWAWWKVIKSRIPLPNYRAMVCAVRMSQEMLYKIKDYASTHKTLFFLEAMIPTLCKSNGLVYHTIDELKYITFRSKFAMKDIHTTHLYHPVKDIAKHKLYRDSIKGLDL